VTLICGALEEHLLTYLLTYLQDGRTDVPVAVLNLNLNSRLLG